MRFESSHQYHRSELYSGFNGQADVIGMKHIGQPVPTRSELTQKVDDQHVAHVADTKQISSLRRLLKVSFIMQGLLAVLLLFMVVYSRDIREDSQVVREETTTAKLERRAYQSETRVLICKLSVDDVEFLSDDEAVIVEELCGDYDTVEHGIESENSRDKNGRITG